VAKPQKEEVAGKRHPRRGSLNCWRIGHGGDVLWTGRSCQHDSPAIRRADISCTLL